MVADLDGDGIIELLAKIEGDGLYSLTVDARYDPGLMVWPKSL